MPPIWPEEFAHSTGAIISQCCTYRYALWRKWDDQLPPLAFLMLNPSTADADKDDRTISMCRYFAKREQFGGIIVANLFALRSTEWSNLLNAPDPVGPENKHWVERVCRSTSKIVVAWGTKPKFHKEIAAMSQFLSALGVHVYCLGKTKDGSPKHPSRLALEAPLVSYF